MGNTRRAKEALHWIPEQKKNLRSATHWKDSVWRNTELMDRTWEDVCLYNLDKDGWKEWTVSV